MSCCYKSWGIGWLASLVLLGLGGWPGLAAEGLGVETPPIRRAIACPQELDTLSPLLLRDLPSYANRVNQRRYAPYRDATRPGHILIASAGDPRPLTLGPGTPIPAQDSPAETVQLFFTTLERQYLPDRAVPLQYHHWVFLTQVNQEWRLVLMRSQLASIPDGHVLAPPEDTSQGVVAQAIRLWLRDCHAQAIDPPGEAADRDREEASTPLSPPADFPPDS
jgi:hypothetical protein